MNKILSILLAMILVVSTTGIGFADFTSDGTVAFTATVTLSGQGSIITPLSANLKKIIDDTSASQVTWTGASAGMNWLHADQYIDVQGFETFSSWGIQIYTNNKSAQANPRYTGTGDPAGLVNTQNTTARIPTCWRVGLSKFQLGSDDLRITEKYIPELGYSVLLRIPSDYQSPTSYFAPWFWKLDKDTPDVDPATPGNQPFGNYQVYATAVGSSGVQIASGTYIQIPSSDSHYYTYVGAKFLNAAAGATYATNTLTVEMYHL